jgi:peptidoglycan/xylan/chitin deacetylase (PgdA/CDA1 family)
MRPRLDRLATLHIASPLRRFSSWEEPPSIPILMYHSISHEDEARVHAYYRTATSPEVFAAQMEYLHKSGYQSCSLTEAAVFSKSEVVSRVKRVAITFDDGYGDFYNEAFPVLNKFNFTASVYLPTSFIGKGALQFKGRDCLTWSEVRELHKYGISFGSHTVTHPQLSSLDKALVEKEISDSKKDIEDNIGSVVDSFAYPYAFPQAKIKFKEMLQDLLRSEGYQNGVCTIVGRAGRNSDPFFLPRLPINDLDDTELFEAKLAGAYDWISSLQSAVKTARACVSTICGQNPYSMNGRG